MSRPRKPGPARPKLEPPKKRARKSLPEELARAGEPRRGFRRRWLTACQDAGVPGRLLHDFRWTAVRNLERRGVAIVSDADLREATRRLAADAPHGHISGHGGAVVIDSAPVTLQNS